MPSHSTAALYKLLQDEVIDRLEDFVRVPVVHWWGDPEPEAEIDAHVTVNAIRQNSEPDPAPGEASLYQIEIALVAPSEIDQTEFSEAFGGIEDGLYGWTPGKTVSCQTPEFTDPEDFSVSDGIARRSVSMQVWASKIGTAPTQ